jgi:hypothetical protein
MTIANLGRQHNISLDSYSKSSCEYLYIFGIISYYFIPSTSLQLIIHILKLILLMFSHSLDNTTTLHHLSYKREDNTSIKRLLFVFPKRVILKRENGCTMVTHIPKKLLTVTFYGPKSPSSVIARRISK